MNTSQTRVERSPRALPGATERAVTRYLQTSGRAKRRDLGWKHIPTSSQEVTMPDHAVAIQVHPAGLREGDRIVVDPDTPGRQVDWTVTCDAYSVGGMPVVDYVTGDGTEGRHGFEPPITMLEVLPAPPPPQTASTYDRAVA